MDMREILDSIETPYVDCQTLLAQLTGYAKPRDCIARMVRKGELWRIRNGFFLIPSRFLRRSDYPYEQIANLLYGPSYISLEWALSFYHFIPERVSTVTSVTTGSSKEFDTPIGRFAYQHATNSRYSIGIDRKSIGGQIGGFLIATPEKALADWVHQTCTGMSTQELKTDLLDAKRIDLSMIRSLCKDQMEHICHQYGSAIVQKLYRITRDI
jgi:predicted transcriptional regulator of viral defense system